MLLSSWLIFTGLKVERARKIQRFMSQPFQVAQVFTGYEGKLVPLKDTAGTVFYTMNEHMDQNECV